MVLEKLLERLLLLVSPALHRFSSAFPLGGRKNENSKDGRVKKKHCRTRREREREREDVSSGDNKHAIIITTFATRTPLGWLVEEGLGKPFHQQQ